MKTDFTNQEIISLTMPDGTYYDTSLFAVNTIEAILVPGNGAHMPWFKISRPARSPLFINSLYVQEIVANYL